jgi:hypothetical protein
MTVTLQVSESVPLGFLLTPHIAHAPYAQVAVWHNTSIFPAASLPGKPTPTMSPPVQQSTPRPSHISTATSTETRKITVSCVPPIPTAAGANDSELHHSPPPLTLSRPFLLVKPLARNMSHAYSPVNGVKPSRLRGILMLATLPKNTAAAAAVAAVAGAEPGIASTATLVFNRDIQDSHPPPGINALVSGITSAPIFERPHPPPSPSPPHLLITHTLSLIHADNTTTTTTTPTPTTITTTTTTISVTSLVESAVPGPTMSMSRFPSPSA